MQVNKAGHIMHSTEGQSQQPHSHNFPSLTRHFVTPCDTVLLDETLICMFMIIACTKNIWSELLPDNKSCMTSLEEPWTESMRRGRR